MPYGNSQPENFIQLAEFSSCDLVEASAEQYCHYGPDYIVILYLVRVILALLSLLEVLQYFHDSVFIFPLERLKIPT
ncbi:uncharacterized protein BDZ99DRAFT_49332 [Mytilinidion resinicola]|uniref:Uncharacterized protein n=1 Tax=Mytilinidion resinicola TaxID=574789 RepID=A0A6A6YJR6_9PEZI|nr:uncharacterized protein BDZ99DRAFT_49332 [Mytilinidion resinicola]KAF2808204.1 hypothetical protein BDZ99DRAFT_49332 [Mytilinidion resinicola]